MLSLAWQQRSSQQVRTVISEGSDDDDDDDVSSGLKVNMEPSALSAMM